MSSPIAQALVVLQVLAGPVVEPVTGHRYLLLEPAPWPESEQVAQQLGGHLASIGSREEQDWVFGVFGNRGGVERSLWIGLFRTTPGGPFVWSDGSPTGFQNWLPGQPDNALGGESFVHMISRANGYGHPGGTWNDLGTPGAPFTEFDPVCGVVELPPLRLDLLASAAGGTLRFSCPTLPGFLYRIQRADDPLSGTWTDTGFAAAGDGTAWTPEIPVTAAPTRFYRVVEAPAMSGPATPGDSVTPR